MKKHLLLISIFCFTAFALQGCSGRADTIPAHTPVVVEVQEARLVEGNDEITYSGTIEESESLPLNFSVIGTVSHVYINEGDWVRKGQLLAELNCESYRNALEISTASRKQAEDAYHRLLPMRENGNLPEIEFVKVETGLHQAQAACAIAQKNLDDCRLISPVDGIVGKRSIEPGMNALPSFATITVVKIQKVFVRVSVSDNEIHGITRGQKASIRVRALGDSLSTGTVEQIGVMADPIAHTYRVRVGLRNPSGALRPGMVCTVALQPQGKAQSIVLPAHAVQVDEHGSAFVYCVDPRTRTASRRAVTIGALLEGGMAVTGGVAPRELVVVAGHHRLSDSTLVQYADR
jgi:membrane fusion protein, multidrug efflux system